MTNSLGDALSALLSDGAGPSAGKAKGAGSAGSASGAGGTALDGLTGARAEVTDVLLRVLGDEAPEEAPGLESSLRGDLGLDRLAVVELLVRCEEETGVRFGDSDAPAMVTLGDVVAHVEAGRGK